MSPGTIALVVIAASILVWAGFLVVVTGLRRRKATRAHPVASGKEPVTSPVQSSAEPTPEVTVAKVPAKELKPLSPEQLAVSRRQFLNRAWTASFTAFLGFFGMSSLSFLWPKLTGGFGTKITAGDYEEILRQVGPDGNFTPLFIPEGRFYLTYYEGTGDSPVYATIGAVDAKIQALYRKCVHLGCSVPKCDSSKLFECPCHGSKYRLHGEYFAGPAPRGLDRFPITIEDGKVVVDTGALQEGPPRGTNTWDRFSEPQGSFCVPQ